MTEATVDRPSTERAALAPRWLRPLPVFLALLVLLPALGVALEPLLGLRVLLIGVLFGLLPALLVVVCGVHEVGHVVGGAATGYRFAGLFVGPLAVARDGARVRIQENSSWALVGGMAICLPPPGLLRDSRQAIAYLAGGPLASAVFGVVMLLLHFGLGYDEVTRRTIVAGQHTVPDLIIGAVTFILGICSLLIAAVTLIPNRVGGFTSDGAALRMLWQRSPDATHWLTVSALMGEAFDGVRPRDWTAERVALLGTIDDASPMAAGCHSMRLQVAVDRDDPDGAADALARLRATMHAAPAIARASLHMAEAWMALTDGRVADARSAYDAGASGFLEPHVRHRVHAAVLFAEGDQAGARAAAAAGLRALEGAPQPYPGLVIPEREALEALASGVRVPRPRTATR